MAHKTSTGSGFTHSLSKFKDKFKEALSAPGDEAPGEGDDSGSDSEPVAMARHFDEAFWVSDTAGRIHTTSATYLRVRFIRATSTSTHFAARAHAQWHTNIRVRLSLQTLRAMLC